jgi:long-chain fatty acid transport protein
MKRLSIFIAFLLCYTLLAGALFASGVDNKTNWSTGYIRTMNRNAVADNPDAVVYNPAGVIKLGQGIHVGVHNQFLFLNYSHESAAETYAAKNSNLLLPSLFVVYNKEKWGVFGAFNIPAGGGRLEYDDGIADINEVVGLAAFNPSANLMGVYYAGTLGGVYAINDMFSVAVSGRYVYAVQKAEIKTATAITAGPLTGITELLDTEANDSGLGATIGLNVALPFFDMNIGVRYETRVILEWEYDKVEGPLATLPPPNGLGLAKGDKFDRDLPAILGLGVSLKPIPMLRTEASFVYYFNKAADWDGAEDDHNNGFEFGAAAEYSFIPGLKGSAGFLIADPGADEDTYITLNPALRSFSIGFGVLVDMIPKVQLELGVLKPLYIKDDDTSDFGLPVEVDKGLWIISAGASINI